MRWVGARWLASLARLPRGLFKAHAGIICLVDEACKDSAPCSRFDRGSYARDPRDFTGVCTTGLETRRRRRRSRRRGSARNCPRCGGTSGGGIWAAPAGRMCRAHRAHGARHPRATAQSAHRRGRHRRAAGGVYELAELDRERVREWYNGYSVATWCRTPPSRRRTVSGCLACWQPGTWPA